MRNIKFRPGEYYHLYNRGVHKQMIFMNDDDRLRFLFLLFSLQTNMEIARSHRFLKDIKYPKNLVSLPEITLAMTGNRYVELSCFALMPNHFHLLVQETDNLGVSKYMQRVLNAYTKYFNTKYEVSGHLFQGPFQAVHVDTNAQLLYLSAYIHNNPKEIKGWKNDFVKFPWSSYQDFIHTNRWPKILKTSVIEQQFRNKNEYAAFVKQFTTGMTPESDIADIRKLTGN